MMYNIVWEVSHLSKSNESGMMPVEAESEKRAIAYAQHVLEDRFPSDYILLECRVRRPGRPVERTGDYRKVSIEIRRDLLEQMERCKSSRREIMEAALEHYLEIQ
jgi:hypothetical protein